MVGRQRVTGRMEGNQPEDSGAGSKLERCTTMHMFENAMIKPITLELKNKLKIFKSSGINI